MRRSFRGRYLAELAEELARRAGILRALLLQELGDSAPGEPLRRLYMASSEALAHDPGEEAFADAIAQTLCSGLLTARWLDRDVGAASRGRSTRRAASEYFQAEGPLLGDLFSWALRPRRPGERGRSARLIDDLIHLFDEIAPADIANDEPDSPNEADLSITHFYEAFLAAYDEGLRSKRGVFFTPRPVVSYIVRSVHEQLKSELGLDGGLASTATWAQWCERRGGPRASIPEGASPNDPFVVILDPAAGTGAFLLECIDVIEREVKETIRRAIGAAGWDDPAVARAWSDYVPKHLLPRLCGYELMLAPYAIARLMISFKLRRTGYRPRAGDPIPVALKDALKAGVHRRFSVVIGNPPYAGLSSNQAPGLVDAYKMVDGEALGERKLWLQDDYVKFMRAAEAAIEETGAGILGFITNHGYLDNPTFRGMRRSLMGTFDRIRLLDLHGNANKRERCPDGSEDQNIFPIRQGVAICLATRGGIGKRGVHRADQWGTRETKRAFLFKNTAATTRFAELDPEAPHYLFEPQRADLREEYERGFSLPSIFPIHGAGFITARDHFVIDFNRKSLLARIADFASPKLDDEAVRRAYFAGRGSSKYPDGDTRGWKLADARRLVRGDRAWKSRAVACLHRPFDERMIYWAPWMIDWPRPEVMRHMMAPGALAISTSRSVEIDRFEHVFCSRLPLGHHSVTAKEVNYLFPLVLEPAGQRSKGARRLNLAPGFLDALSSALGIRQRRPGCPPEGVSGEAIFGYIYAILHSPRYRSRYFERIRGDFPRIPLPRPALFAPLSALGLELASHHLMEARYPDASLPPYFGGKPATIEKVSFADGAVFIDKNRKRGFRGISEEVWAFRIGGYRICDRWLADRRSLLLSPADIKRYQRVVAALGETVRLMRSIDELVLQHGGFPGAFTRATTEVSISEADLR